MLKGAYSPNYFANAFGQALTVLKSCFTKIEDSEIFPLYIFWKVSDLGHYFNKLPLADQIISGFEWAMLTCYMPEILYVSNVSEIQHELSKEQGVFLKNFNNFCDEEKGSNYDHLDVYCELENYFPWHKLLIQPKSKVWYFDTHAIVRETYVIEESKK